MKPGIKIKIDWESISDVQYATPTREEQLQQLFRDIAYDFEQERVPTDGTKRHYQDRDGNTIASVRFFKD